MRQQSQEETFQESVAIEMGDAGKNYLQIYLAMAGRVAGGDFTAILD